MTITLSLLAGLALFWVLAYVGADCGSGPPPSWPSLSA